MKSLTDEMPEAAKRLLKALIDIEERAIEAARQGGCKCGKPAPDSGGRDYPFAIFNAAEAMGKPVSRTPWKMQHEPGCLMDGQEGVG